MCGIAGYAGANNPALLKRMCHILAHRGPDDYGTWVDSENGIGLGHRRLSIVDLSSAAHQPMISDDGLIVLSYNGEIYNFREQRDRLEAFGVRFRSKSDTEVILRLYQQENLKCLRRLNGMFAFALWDGRLRRLLLARDHAGIKPLYYCIHYGALYFASEIKALLAIPDFPRKLDEEMLDHYLNFLWVPGDRTLLAGIRKVEPGHYVLWENGQIDIRSWYRLEHRADNSVPLEEWIHRVGDTFIRVTRRQMVADVPLGAFLSGGLDSSSIVACMRAAFPDREIKSYTARFKAGAIAEEQGVDDYPFAQSAAKHLHVDLHNVDIDANVVELLPKMVYHLDEPDPDPAVFPSYLIAKQARADGIRVLLSGTGGDEVFFGYRSHQAIAYYELFPALVRRPIASILEAAAALMRAYAGAHHRVTRRLRKFSRALSATSALARHMELADWSDPVTRRQLQKVPLAVASPGIPGFLKYYSDIFEGQGALNHHSFLLIQTFLAAHNFLYTDKTSMANSLEVRVPFMDTELLELAARIPEHYKLYHNTTKFVLKRAMEEYLPKNIIYREKTGFGVPLRRWIREDLHEAFHSLLGPGCVKARGLFHPGVIQTLIEENDTKRADHGYLLYALLNLELWMQTFIDRPGVAVTL